MILPASYQSGFAPRDGEPLYPELWRGCVGSWSPGLGPTGLTLRDWSGFGNHGVLTNGPTWGVNQGRYAVGLDGSNDYISIPSVGTLISGNNSFAIHVSFSVASFANAPLLFTWFLSGSNDLGFVEFNSVGNQIFWGVRNTSQGQTSYRTYPVSSLGSTVHHLLMQKTGAGNSGNLYLDGVLQTAYSGTLQDTPSSLAGLYVGIYSNGILPLSGAIHELGVFNRNIETHARLLASRRGIAHELAPVRYAGESVAAYTRRLQTAQLVGGGLIG